MALWVVLCSPSATLLLGYLAIRLAGHPLLPARVPQAHGLGFSRFRKVCMTRGNSDLMMYR